MTSSVGPLVEVINVMGARSLTLRDGAQGENDTTSDMEEFWV